MKLILCIALHLYHGPVAPETQVTVLAEECKAVSLEAARRAIAKCAKQSAERCEVLGPKDGRILIENKVQVSP